MDNLGQRGVGVGDESGQGENGGDSKSDAGWNGVTIQPERDPRQHDNQTRRNVYLNHVVAEATNEVQMACQPRVVTFIHPSIISFIYCLFVN